MRRDDNKLSLLASTDLFHPITGTCHVTVLSPCGCFLCVVCFLLFLLFGSLCFGSFSLERDKGIGLCIGPLPVDFCGPTAWPLRELLINLTCNMIGNMLNDLTEAIRRWTEKK